MFQTFRKNSKCLKTYLKKIIDKKIKEIEYKKRGIPIEQLEESIRRI